MHDHHWFEELRYQFERRGLSLILKGHADREWIATAWHRLARVQYGGGDSPVARALGATPREAALRLLMVLDDAQEDGSVGHVYPGADPV